MDASTATGIGLVVLSAGAWFYPKLKARLDARNSGVLPHDHVKSLIDYFSGKKCKRGVEKTVEVGKLLYEECTDHLEEDNTPVNNLP
jgi:hypothetical protein